MVGKMLTAKLTSAIVLGAICFFSGKFLEMYRAQQKQDRDTIEKCVNEIKKGKIVAKK
jgi:preprotein translocase subunit YajC